MGKNTRSAGKGLNPKFNSKEYVNSPYWDKKEHCVKHGIALQHGRCYECDWDDAQIELSKGYE